MTLVTGLCVSSVMLPQAPRLDMVCVVQFSVLTGVRGKVRLLSPALRRFRMLGWVRVIYLLRRGNCIPSEPMP